MNIDNPRESVIESIKTSLPQEEWDNNFQFVTELKNKIKSHSLMTNKTIGPLSSGLYPSDKIQTIHLEYRHAIVQIFTDALLMAQFQTRHLEPRMSAGAKMGPRFLLTLNILDEFGFTPGLDANNYYRGRHCLAHYNLYEKLLGELGILEQERLNFLPSKISTEVRLFLESSYDDYVGLLALMAVAEEQVILFSPVLRKSVESLGCDVSQGYYKVHGTTDDVDTDGADDDHEDDLWIAVAQACRPKDYVRITALCLEYCDLWNSFWDCQSLTSTSEIYCAAIL
ncbi:MAG: hypothetical protein JKX82_01925 [Oleispira sp.]|nr:hypothetical protein [Oleispira sp.]